MSLGHSKTGDSSSNDKWAISFLAKDDHAQVLLHTEFEEIAENEVKEEKVKATTLEATITAEEGTEASQLA